MGALCIHMAMQQRSIIIMLILLALIYAAVRWSEKFYVQQIRDRPLPQNYDAVFRSFDG